MYRKRALVSAVIVLAMFLVNGVSVAESDRPVTLNTDPNLAGWWRFDETSGPAAKDSSSGKREATLKGNLSFKEDSVPGRTGKAIELDGSENLIEVTHYKGVTGTQCRTVAVWIKTATAQGQIISWGTEDFGKMWTFGHIRGRVGVTPHGGYLYMNRRTDDNKWHHVAAVVRQAELPNLFENVTLYLDGAIAEIHDIGLLDLWPIETGDELDVKIGRGFKGALDDLRIYDRALSDEEVQVLFKLESDRPAAETKK